MGPSTPLGSQAEHDERGAMQGASETIKTLCSIVAGPIMSLVFGYGINAQRQVKFPGLVFVFASGLLVGACYLAPFVLAGPLACAVPACAACVELLFGCCFPCPHSVKTQCAAPVPRCQDGLVSMSY